jgi:hypothetical protein
MRKIIPIAAAVMFLFSVPAARGAVEVAVGSATVSPGSTVTVPVTISGMGSLVARSYQVNLSFDGTALTAPVGTKGPATPAAMNFASNAPSAGKFRSLAFEMGTGPATLDGVLYSIAFTVPSGASPGTYSLTIGTLSVLDGGNNPITVTKTNGTITVAGAPVAPIIDIPPSTMASVVLTVGSATVAPESTVTVPVTISGMESLAARSYRVNLSFDGAALIVPVVTKGPAAPTAWIFASQTPSAGNLDTLSFELGTGPEILDGVLYNITFTAPFGVSPGTYDLTVGKLLLLDGNNQPITVTKVNGTISVTEPGSVMPSAPSIDAQPSDATVRVRDWATFTVVASGAAPLSYQWQSDHGAGWTDIAYDRRAVYTTWSTASGDDGTLYRCVVANRLGRVVSDPARLTVTQRGRATITVGPASAVAGSEVTVPVSISGKDAPAESSYQINLSYDGAVLTAPAVAVGPATPTGWGFGSNSPAVGTLRTLAFRYGGSSQVLNGELFYVTFTVSGEVAAGGYPVSIGDGSCLFDANNQEVDITPVPGVITVLPPNKAGLKDISPASAAGQSPGGCAAGPAGTGSGWCLASALCALAALALFRRRSRSGRLNLAVAGAR